MNDNNKNQTCTAYVRAYAKPVEQPNNHSTHYTNWKQPIHNQVDEILTIDTETSMDVDKSLLYGFALHTGRNRLKRLIVFYEPEQLTQEEIQTLQDYANSLDLSTVSDKLEIGNEGLYKNALCMPVNRFIKWMYEAMRYNHLLIVGHNLAYDLSRLATSWYEPKNRWAGGFGLTLSEHYPALLVKHIGYAKNLWGIAKKYYRDKNGKVKVSTAYDSVHFVDTMTLSGAILGEPVGLSRLGEKLNIPAHLQKFDRPEHDYRPTKDNLAYASQDVLTTYTCYQELQTLYNRHNLNTSIWNMLSGASLGKAYLREIGIKSFSELHPDFPGSVIGAAMNSYFGGRSEINIRLNPVRGRLRDFSGEYPVSCALMHIQDFLLSENINIDRSDEARERIQALLSLPINALLEYLHDKNNWRQLTTLVKIKPDGDRLPLRTNYGDGNSTNIALPYVTSEIPLWYTLADVIASKLLIGNTPEVVEAIILNPGETQYEVKPIKIMGEDAIDLTTEDFFIRVGDLRNKYKALKKKDKSRATYYDSIQTALKLMQNSTSYGSLVEINQSDETSNEHEVAFYDNNGKACISFVNRLETPGRFFSPLGAFIPACGRLLLAIAQRLASDRNIQYAFMDTDSSFFVCPDNMSWSEFVTKEEEIGNWFQPLSPYADTSVDLFKLELDDVWFIGISAKRYCLYRKDNNEFELVKVSSHGTGAIKRPYNNDKNPFNLPDPNTSVKASRWVHDLWYAFVYRVLNGTGLKPVNERELGFDIPTQHQVTITTPHLLKVYSDIPGLRPYNFFVVLAPISPFTLLKHSGDIVRKDDNYTEEELLFKEKKTLYSELVKAQTPFYTWDERLEHEIRRCDNHAVMPAWLELTTIGSTLFGYFSHKESKALNPTAKGLVGTRTVVVTDVKFCGKEVNEVLEEMAQDSNGFLPESSYKEVQYSEADNIDLKRKIKHYGIELVSNTSGLPRRNLYNLLNGTKPGTKTVGMLNKAFDKLEKENNRHE